MLDLIVGGTGYDQGPSLYLQERNHLQNLGKTLVLDARDSDITYFFFMSAFRARKWCFRK